ncbi:MAG: GAF domain-containing protein [Anaerolineae bacterium]|nr:GAF domain-containing protein [Anaerolineae bacterium]
MVSERIQSILKSAYAGVARLLQFERFYVILYDELRKQVEFPLVAEQGEFVTGEAWMQRSYQGTTFLPDAVIAQRKPLLLEKQVAAELGSLAYWPKGDLPLSWLGVPMVAQDQMIGTLVVENWQTPMAFGERAVRLLSTIAGQTAVALQSARLDERLDRRLKNLNAVYAVGQTLTSSIGMNESQILTLLRKQASAVMNTANMYIALYDPDPNCPDLYHPEDASKCQIHGTVRFPLMYIEDEPAVVESRKATPGAYGRTEVILATRRPIFNRTQAESVAWYEQQGRREFIGRKFASWIGVPIIAGENALGVIAAYHDTDDFVYDDEDLQVLRLMAGQAAIALENARLYQEARSEVVANKQLATLGTAMGTLQHRINNTFNIIAPNVTRLRKRVDTQDAETLEILDIIERNARYTSDIVTRILEQLHTGETQLVDVNSVLVDVVNSIRDLRRRDRTQPLIAVDLDLDDSLSKIEAPVGQIAEVFRNLVDNAYRAMKQGGHLRVSSCMTNNSICVRVQDSGPGIPPPIQSRLFKKPAPSKEPGGGAGLGLWLSSLVLQSVGGCGKIEKSDSAGTIMLVEIPVKEVLP